MKHLFAMPALAVLTLAACQTSPHHSSPAGLSDAERLSVYQAALTSPYRTEQDVERDNIRKPVETLSFSGVKPGDSVLEIEAGGGYFTSLLAASVGPEGQVYMQNPASFDQFWGGGDPPRMADMPAQVTYLRSQFDDFSALPDESIDIVTWLQGPHELWYLPENTSESLGDADKTFIEIARVLKPGGVLVVQDHRAPKGSPRTTGGDTHRIDEDHIDMLAASAGLTKTATSSLFENPEDDLTLNVFDPAVRSKTNQFLVSYTKQ